MQAMDSPNDKYVLFNLNRIDSSIQTIKSTLFSVELRFVTYESSLCFSLFSTNVTVPDKVVGKMLALYMVLHIRLRFMAETAAGTFVSSFSSNNILQQVFKASHK